MKGLFTGIGVGIVFLVGWLILLSTGHNITAPYPAAGSGFPDSPDSSGLTQHVESIDLSGPFLFAGEPLAIENFDVRERLDLELMRNAYFHRNTLLLLKRQGRYFPTIERVLQEKGLPEDLKYLAAAESTLEEVVSPAGAKGVWQIMAPTGRAYGLEINDEVDERYHLEKATRAAADYLQDYYEDFGDWKKVAAAYNMGGPNLKKWLDRQRAEEYADLDINRETMQYLFRIVALKYIMEEPEKFGYHLQEADQYPVLDDYRTVAVRESIANVGDFARANGTTYRLLKLYNPWLISGSLTVRSGNSYDIRIPNP